MKQKISKLDFSGEKLIIESLAMDLKRVALGLHRKSFVMADRFKEEALKRYGELEEQRINGYLYKLVVRSKQSLIKNDDSTAEDVLMYSTLFQNYALKP